MARASVRDTLLTSQAWSIDCGDSLPTGRNGRGGVKRRGTHGGGPLLGTSKFSIGRR